MKNIVFLVGEYHPFFSAVATCCYNIAEEISINNKVTIICFKSDIKQSDKEVYNGQNIIRISNFWWDQRLNLSSKISTHSGIKRKIFSFILNLIKIRAFCQIIFSKVSIRNDMVRTYSNALNQISYQIDALIPFCFPYETVLAAMKHKSINPETKLIPYLFDPFVDSDTLHRTNWNKKIKKNANKKIEEHMFRISEKVFCVNQLKLHFSNYPKYSFMINYTEHPLLKRKIITDNKLTNGCNDTIVATYTGVFDKYIRNPEYFLKIMNNALEESNSVLKLYSYGNCQNIIDKFANESNGRIINFGYVPKYEADIAILNSDVLISVGNIDNKQVPSKIIEYISALKPIIHFYSNDNDVNIQILKDYPLSICIKQDEANYFENVSKCDIFIKASRFKTISYSMVEKTYITSTPKFIANQILKYV